MRVIQASEAKTHLASLLDEVERGETLVITRHGRPIARIVPEADRRQAAIDRALAQIVEFRKTAPRIALADIMSARHEGHKY
jgi:prevent-host-death family protein